MDVLDEAEEYELFGYPHTEIQDCDFLEDVFDAYGQNRVHEILDVACGTGRHALEMAGRGYAVTGIDLSENMLRAARKKASEQNLKIKFLQRDMRKLRFGEAFDAAYILFNTLMLITRNEDLIRVLKGINESLRAKGLLIVEVGNLWSYIAQGKFMSESHVREEENFGIKRLLDVKTVIGSYNNVYCHKISKRLWRKGEELQSGTEITLERAFSVNEFDLLCRLTRFRILEVFGSTDVSKKIGDPDRIEEIEEP